MSHIEILLPFGLPPVKSGLALLRQLHEPALATMISRPRKTFRQPDFAQNARALPHEAWMAFHFGLTEQLTQTNSPPFASLAMYLHGIGQQTGIWFILHPAHFQLGQDHMIMADRRTLSLSDSESRQLFDATLPSFEHAGKRLIYGDPMTWFVRADDWKDLITTSPDMACGRNLAQWMPVGPGELAWRKLLNEVQMLWHAHPVNAERETRKLMRVNALWLWAGASGFSPNFPAILPYTNAYHFVGRLETFGQFFPEHEPNFTANDILAHPPEHGLVFLDTLIAPALANNWSAWLSAYKKLEKEWFAPLLEGLQQRQIERITLNMSNDLAMKTFVVDRSSLRKFWKRKSMAPLLQ